MLLDWPAEFGRQLDRLDEQVAAGDKRAQIIRRIVDIHLEYLQNGIDGPPDPSDESKMLRWVRQSGKHSVWRLSHRYIEGVAVRTIVWFPEDGVAVVLLFYGDKSHIGDLFYDSVGSRADQAISQYLREIGSDDNAKS